MISELLVHLGRAAMAAGFLLLVGLLIGAAFTGAFTLMGITTFTLKGVAGGALLAVTLRLTLME